MFTNKNKLIGFIALIVVVVLVGSAAIALIADNAVKNAAAELAAQAAKEAEDRAKAEAQTEIKKLNDTIADLQKLLAAAEGNLADANEEIADLAAKLEGVMNLDPWNEATKHVVAKLGELLAKYETVEGYYDLVSADAVKSLKTAYDNAYWAIVRSSSVADMDKVLADFDASLEAFNATRYDVILAGKIEAVKAEGVIFPEDVAGTEDAQTYYDSFLNNQVVIDKFVELGLDKELAKLWAALDADEEADLAAAFIAAVEAIETPVTLATTTTAAEDAWTAYVAVLESDDVHSAAVVAARATLDTYNARLVELAAAKAEADVINAKIAAVVVEAHSNTKATLDAIKAEIAAWVATYKTNDCDANYNMVNHDALQAHYDAYAVKVADVTALYEAFKAAVEAIGNITPNSKALLDAAHAAYDAVKNTDADAMIPTATPNTVAELKAVLDSKQATYDEIIDLIAKIRAEIDRLYAADPNVTHDEIKALDEMIITLTHTYGQDLAVIGEDYIARYNVVVLIPHKNDAMEKVHVIYMELYNAANGDREVLVKLGNSYAAQREAINALTEIADIQAKGADKYIRDTFAAALTDVEK